MSRDQFFFNLNDNTQGISRELAPGLTTRIFVGDQAMLSVVELEPFAQGETHSHPQEQWGVLLRGEGVRLQDSTEYPVRKGDFWRTPGGVPHAFKAGPEGATILDVFSPPRDEYRTSGVGFGSS